MMFEKPDLATLESESDVESKFLYPLIAGEIPSGLGFGEFYINIELTIFP